MERILQYFDDLDDLYGLLGLLFEPLRDLLVRGVVLLALLIVTASAFQLADAHPPLAMGTSTLLLVALLYRFVAGPPPARHPTTG